MKTIIFGAVLAVIGAVAQAGGSAVVTCGNAAPGFYNNGQAPVLKITYAPGGDVGVPGLFWLGVLTPDQRDGAVLTDQGWSAYHGGLYPFQARYDGGLPGVISLTVAFPGSELTTAGFVGYGVYVGHGAYTAQAMQAVASRRAALDRVRAKLIAAGTWSAEYDSDDRYIWSLVQKNMMDSQKYGSVMTVPFIDCTPLSLSE